MSQSKLTVNVRSINPQTAVLEIQGEITAFAEGTLMDAYTRVTDEGARNVILNFRGLEYMNSSGIGLLVTLLIRANRQKQRLMAVELKDHYRHIFDLTRLNEAIRIYSTEAEALAELNPA